MRKNQKQYLSMSLLLACLACSGSAAANAQQTPDDIETLTPSQAPTKAPAQKSEAELREQYEQSMTYMLRRAKLMRTLAAQHILYLGENAEDPELHLVEEASQVVAFDLVCSDDTFDPAVLDQMATESNYRIAVQAAKSPIAETLAEIGRGQSIQERMNLLGDISTTVFMFQVGRRRGLFDSLMTDFGKTKFCDGLRPNMRDRYVALTSEQR